MIINTGMRTDIPAFYPEWLCCRLREGYVMSRSPYSPDIVYRYDIDPECVDLISFCTKNPIPMLDKMSLLEDYGQFWYVTITPYGEDIEPNVPQKREIIRAFRELSSAISKKRIGWRYDPVILTEKYDEDFHKESFATMAAALQGCTEICVISFIDLYEKVKRNFPTAQEVPMESRRRLGKFFAETAIRHGMILRPCVEGSYLAEYGADCSGCLTIPVLENALGENLSVPQEQKKRSPRRITEDGKTRTTGCACHLSADIGAYDSCGHLCRYCYANSSAESVRRNMSRHDPRSPLLIGRPSSQDRIIQVRQKSWRTGQGLLL